MDEQNTYGIVDLEFRYSVEQNRHIAILIDDSRLRTDLRKSGLAISPTDILTQKIMGETEQDMKDKVEDVAERFRLIYKLPEVKFKFKYYKLIEQ